MSDLLGACREGDEEAFRLLITLVYSDLLRIAHRQLRRHRFSETLNTVALVHETYLKLSKQQRTGWRDQAVFFAIAARVMRQTIVDWARKKTTSKRGGGARLQDIDEVEPCERREAELIVAVDQAMVSLGAFDRRLVNVVECRFFAGLTEEETALALGVSLRTVQRDWRKARGWLREEIGDAAAAH